MKRATDNYRGSRLFSVGYPGRVVQAVQQIHLPDPQPSPSLEPPLLGAEWVLRLRSYVLGG